MLVPPFSIRARTGNDAYGGETERVNFDSEGRNVLLLELSSQVTLNEGGLSKAQIVSFKAPDVNRSCIAGLLHTFPVPPSPTRTSLKVGTSAF